MKNTILTVIALVCIMSISLFGCKKDFQHGEEKTAETVQQSVESQSSTQSSSFADNLSVSQYGFLVFPSTDDLEEYKKFVLSSTHAEVQDYLSTLSFTCLGETLYGEDYQSEKVTEEQAIDYVFNTAKIFQLGDVIMKPIAETNDEVKWQFLLAMTSANLNNSSYEYMASGIYDGNTMNKFATNPSDEEAIDIFEFMADTPYGYEETEVNASAARRPFWGYACEPGTSGNYPTPGQPNCMSIMCRARHHIFWIPHGELKDMTVSTVCS